MKLLIPAAKCVPSDLQNIGKLPAIIYPVNGGIMFDFLKNKYETNVSEIHVLCYERTQEVQGMLQACHMLQGVRLKITTLEKLGDLGNTIYQGLSDTDEDVVINFADTMVMDPIPLEKQDFIVYAEDFPDKTWSYFQRSEGEITQICDKQDIFGTEKKPLFVGVFKFQSGQYLKDCLRQAFEADSIPMDSFYYALMLYSKRFPFDYIHAGEWLDIGHAKGYFESKLQVRARAFNHIHIDQERGILEKTSEDKEKFIGEIKWYLKLPEDLEYVHPRIFSYSTHYEKLYVKMEYYSYHTLHELFLYGDLTYDQWDRIFRHIYFIMEDFNRYQLRKEGLKTALKEMYLDKTLSRLEILKENPDFCNVFQKPIQVNGISYKPLNEICEILADKIPQFLYDADYFPVIHGDLCFTNILVDHNFSFIKLIDPRGRFGPYDLYGDRRYEIAKILHSIHGKYDFIIKDLFQLKQPKEGEFLFQIIEPERKFEISKIFLSVFRNMIKDCMEQIKIIEALLFLSMIPLHHESLQHQYAMLCTGVSLLDEIIPIRMKDGNREEN